jgi:hypothetical protein
VACWDGAVRGEVGMRWDLAAGAGNLAGRQLSERLGQTHGLVSSCPDLTAICEETLVLLTAKR